MSGRGSQRHAPAQPRAAQWQQQLQAREMKPSSVQIKHPDFQMTGRGRGGRDGNYHGTQLVMMNKSGSGSVGLEAASSTGTMGAGSRRQCWRTAMEQHAAGAAGAGWWVLLRTCCSWAPSEHELGQGAASGWTWCPEELAAGVGWDGGCIQIRSGSGGAE